MTISRRQVVAGTANLIAAPLAIVSDPRFEFSATPLRIQFISDFLFRQKRVKEKLASWKDIFWPDAWSGRARESRGLRERSPLR